MTRALAVGLLLGALVGGCFSDRTPAELGNTIDCQLRIPSADVEGALRASGATPLPATGAAEAADSVVIVAIRGFDFHPRSVSIPPGGTVVWINCEPEGTEPHTSTSTTGVWGSPFLEPGDAYAHKFDAAGTFPYLCIPHPFMQGTVVVSE